MPGQRLRCRPGRSVHYARWHGRPHFLHVHDGGEESRTLHNYEANRGDCLRSEAGGILGQCLWRIRNAQPEHTDGYEDFRDLLPDLTKIYILHKASYTPSEDAIYWLPNDTLNVMVPIALADNIATTISNLPQAPAGETYGILVLPADRFFGERETSISAATSRRFPTYWSVTDFVGQGGAAGGCGVPQLLSGRFMAERVANIWTKNAIPTPRFGPDPEKVHRNEIQSGRRQGSQAEAIGQENVAEEVKKETAQIQETLTIQAFFLPGI